MKSYRIDTRWKTYWHEGELVSAVALAKSLGFEAMIAEDTPSSDILATVSALGTVRFFPEASVDSPYPPSKKG